MASVNAEVRELADYIRSLGFSVAIEGDGHYHVYRNGKPVTHPNGAPVTLPSTPSDHTWRKNTILALKRAKVIDEDPRKTEQIKLAKRDPELRQAREALRSRETQPRRYEREMERRRRQWEKVKPVAQGVKEAMTTLGVTQREFARLAQKSVAARGVKPMKNDQVAGVAINKLLKTPDLDVQPASDYALSYWTAALKELGVELASAPDLTWTPEPVANGAASAGNDAEAGAESEIPVSELVKTVTHGLPYRTVSLYRPAVFSEGHWICGCGHECQDRRSLKAHVRSAHVELQHGCGRWIKAGGFSRHEKFCQGGEVTKLPEKTVEAIQKSPELELIATVDMQQVRQVKVTSDIAERLRRLYYLEGFLDGIGRSDVANEHVQPLVEEALAEVA